MYNGVDWRAREDAETYADAIREFVYEEEWFPMSLATISKFEKAIL